MSWVGLQTTGVTFIQHKTLKCGLISCIQWQWSSQQASAPSSPLLPFLVQAPSKKVLFAKWDLFLFTLPLDTLVCRLQCRSACHCQQSEGYELTCFHERLMLLLFVNATNRMLQAGSVRLMLITSDLDHFLSFEEKKWPWCFLCVESAVWF